MGWSDTWSDILSGGNKRWKVTNSECHEKAYSHFHRYVHKGKHEPPSETPTSVLCPLAGDDPFVHLLFQKGYSVTTIDLVPAAVEAMKSQFDLDGDSDGDGDGGETTSTFTWEKVTSDNGDTIWKHNSGRATFIVGDALQKRADLVHSFDAVYDKDSFGALDKQNREPFCKRMAEFIKPNGIVYLECKLRDNHEESKHMGPPFSLTKEDLMMTSNYGAEFNYVESIGPVYKLDFPMKQMGHVLKKK